MPAPGRKPKPEDQRRNQNRPLIDWIDVQDEPYDGPRPTLPRVPAATKRWWEIVSRMPHCVLWSDADWEFAVGTAMVHKAWMQKPTAGAAAELRQREKLLGMTWDARRDLRIRYVPVGEVEESERPVSLDERRRELQG